MGTSLANLLILSTLFAGALTLYGVTRFNDWLVGNALTDAAQSEGQRARTAISISSIGITNVFFRCDASVDVRLENTGDAAIEGFDQMDVLTYYTTEAGAPVTRRFAYTAGNLGKGQWAVASITPDNSSPGIWDPGETAALSWRFVDPQKEGTSGYVIVGAPNGVSDSGYVTFSDVSSADCRFLHNYPTPPLGDTASQMVLPLDAALPSADTLHNYATDHDTEPGLRLLRSSNGLDETIAARFQVWSTGPLPDPLIIAGDVLIGIWSALTPANSGETGVVITSSTAGIVGAAGMSAYVTSKHAVIGLMRTAALECAPLGIRVNTVNPSPIETRMMRSLEEMLATSADSSTVTVKQTKQAFAARIPL